MKMCPNISLFIQMLFLICIHHKYSLSFFFLFFLFLFLLWWGTSLSLF